MTGSSIAISGMRCGPLTLLGFSGPVGGPVTSTLNVTTYGSMEAGGGTITNLAAGTGVVIMGPIQTPVRESLRQIVFASATGSFNLDYQYTTDGGTNWYSKQFPSTTTVADGTGNPNTAHLKVVTGFQWKVVIWNTGNAAINAVFEKRLISRGRSGN